MSDSTYNHENEYSLYEINKGDTLESIAIKLGIDFDELRQFHNKWSKLEDCLAGWLPRHLKHIKISNKKEEQQEISGQNKPVAVRFISYDFILPFMPFNLHHQYSVLYTIEKGDTIQTLQQNYKLRRLQPDSDQNDYHFIQIDKISELLIDGKPIEIKAYSVAEKTAQLLFPLRIVVDKYGKWYDLNSYDKLKERWEKQKEEIRDAYDGEVYQKIAENIEGVITDDNSLINHITGNWFLKAFFNGIHMAYTRNFEIQKELYFPVLAEEEEIEFLITQKVNPYLNDSNLIEVTQKGVSENECLEEYYNAKYLLNPNHYNIESLELECSLIELNQKIKVEVKNLDQNKVQFHSISLLA
ncbi:LysM domain-containing protein [Flavobacterium aquidurense]|uniref:LysM peptidoglycan-binding domain-containing protein n=1 Tax=Flavobacterium aquidurense TaxID=362413 RepID=UPI002865DFFC|nr:LysM domain-containing protein [Flavobacterium aquidurense]MDR7371314.1 LysM repeat protein [Flavobacterium aquidurense]